MTESNTSAIPQSPSPGDTFMPTSRVLIVDDNPQNVELLQGFLESLPIQIFTAGDGITTLT